MSQWTHVAGLIRLDSMGQIILRYPGSKYERIKRAIIMALGNTCDFTSERDVWDNCSVPCGSEGSLQYNVYPNSDNEQRGVVWGYVALWGDLRDFGAGDVAQLHGWFQKSIDRLQKPEGFGSPETMNMSEKAEFILSTFIIRDAVLSIDVEFAPRQILVWDADTKKVIAYPPVPGNT